MREAFRHRRVWIARIAVLSVAVLVLAGASLAAFLPWNATGIAAALVLAALPVTLLARLLMHELALMERASQRLAEDAVALRRSQSLLAETGRLAGIGGWELDIQSRVLSWTEETRRIHGVEPHYEPRLDAAIAFFAPDAQPALRLAIDTCLIDGTPWDLELPFIRANGVPRWVRAVGSAVSEGGRAVRLMGAYQDVTAQVEARHALAHAKERVAIAVEDAGFGIWEWMIGTDRLEWDPSMFQLYGCAPDDAPLTYERWRRFLHPEDLDATEALLAAAAQGHGHFDTEFRIRWPDGSLRYLRASARLIRDAAARPLRMVGLTWDVTEARRLAAERDRQALQLSESESILRLVAENATDVIIWVGPDGSRRYVSPPAEQLLGFPAAALLGRARLPVFDDADLDLLRRTNAALLDGSQTSCRVTFRIRHPQRGEVWIESNARALPNHPDGAGAGFVAVMRDHTEEIRLQAEHAAREHEAHMINAELERLARHLGKARDRAESASRAKSRFLANTSHELRTPLNGILGYTQLFALRGGLDAEQTRWIEAMMGAGQHLLEMITKVLDLTAIEVDHVQLDPIEFDLRPILASCIEVVRPAAAEKGLVLTLGEGTERPARVVTDAGRLRQVLLNLLGNAVKFTPAGAVTIRLRGTDPAAPLRIEVVDTGPGIAPDDRDRLFQEFERLDSDSPEGAGLGLALSARLAGLLGGSLGHDPNPEGGSIFWLDLPRDTAAARPSLAAVPHPAATVPSGTPAQPLRVLVVDDVAMNRDIACSFLTMAGHLPRQASGGEEAIAAVIAESFDVVLMDIRMPEVDGLEATRRIRALGGTRGRVPIIGLSALAFGEHVQECLAAGMDGHLAKPYAAEALLRITRDAAAKSVAPVVAEPGPAPSGPSPLRDPSSVESLLRHLPSDRILAYERETLARGRELLTLLRAPDRDASGLSMLVEKLHRLAGSAGLLGFDRLSEDLREWETRQVDGIVEAGLLDRIVATIGATNDLILTRLDAAPQTASA